MRKNDSDRRKPLSWKPLSNRIQTWIVRSRLRPVCHSPNIYHTSTDASYPESKKRSRSNSHPFEESPAKKKRQQIPSIPPARSQAANELPEDGSRLSRYGLGPYDTPVSSPRYLAFKIQHKILTRVQTILEECLYDFAQDWFAPMMEKEGWESADEVEYVITFIPIFHVSQSFY